MTNLRGHRHRGYRCVLWEPREWQGGDVFDVDVMFERLARDDTAPAQVRFRYHGRRAPGEEGRDTAARATREILARLDHALDNYDRWRGHFGVLCDLA